MLRALPFALFMTIAALPLTLSNAQAAAALDATGATGSPQTIYPSEQVSEVPDTDIQLPPTLAAPAPAKTAGILGTIPAYGPLPKAAVTAAASTPAPATPTAFPPPPASIANTEDFPHMPAMPVTAVEHQPVTVAAASAPAPASTAAQLKIGHLAMVHAIRPKPAMPQAVASAAPEGVRMVDPSAVDPTLLKSDKLFAAAAHDQNNFLSGRDMTVAQAEPAKIPPVPAEPAAGAALSPPEDPHNGVDMTMTPMPDDGKVLQTAEQTPEPLAGPDPVAAAEPAKADVAAEKTASAEPLKPDMLQVVAPPPAPAPAVASTPAPAPHQLAEADIPRGPAPGPAIHHHAASAPVTVAANIMPPRVAAPEEDDDDRLAARERAALDSTMAQPASLERGAVTFNAAPSTCRGYTRNVVLSNGAPARVAGTACLDQNNAWRITSEHLIASGYSHQRAMRVRYLRTAYGY